MKSWIDPTTGKMVLSNRRPKRDSADPLAMMKRFKAAKSAGSFDDWVFQATSINSELISDQRALRNRARELAKENPWVNAFARIFGSNVFGARGIGMESQVTKRGKPEELDEEINGIIENWWDKFTKNCDVEGHLTLQEMEALAGKNDWCDGEYMILCHENWSGNAEGLGLELVNIDRLMVNYNKDLGGGRIIRLGIQYSAEGAVEGYHLRQRHTEEGWGDQIVNSQMVPASKVIYGFLKQEAGQIRGYSWLAPVMRLLQWLDGYVEAGVIAARTGAVNQGFFRDPTQEEGVSPFDGVDDMGNTVMEASPGEYRYIGALEYQSSNPDYPHAMFDEFVKAVLRAITAALPASYTSISGDLSSVNYTSLRHERLSDQEAWEGLQNRYISKIREPIWNRALFRAIGNGLIELPGRFAFTDQTKDFQRLNQPRWMPVKWEPVDPNKQAQADTLKLQNGLTSRRRLILEAGDDPNEIDREIASDSFAPSQQDSKEEEEEEDEDEMG